MAKSQRKLQSIIDRFNRDCPVGTTVLVEKDNGEKIKTKVKHPATILGGHTAVGWFEDITGCYILNRVTKVLDDE